MNYKIKCRIKSRGTHRRQLRRFVYPEKVVTIEKPNLLETVRERLREGCEVRIGTMDDCVRLYFCLDESCKKVLVCAQTMGGMRHFMEDAETEIYHGKSDEPLTDAEVRDKVRKAESRFVGVTPSSIVTCPECGFEFRVGKQLT